jgi:hypothetical protein
MGLSLDRDAAAGKAAPAEARKDRRAAPSLEVRALSSTAISSAEALVTRVKLALAGASGACGLAGGAAIELRLLVDAKGKVTAVDLVRGEARQLACLRRRLLGLASDTRAQGGRGGKLELRITAL